MKVFEVCDDSDQAAVSHYWPLSTFMSDLAFCWLISMEVNLFIALYYITFYLYYYHRITKPLWLSHKTIPDDRPNISSKYNMNFVFFYFSIYISLTLVPETLELPLGIVNNSGRPWFPSERIPVPPTAWTLTLWLFYLVRPQILIWSADMF